MIDDPRADRTAIPLAFWQRPIRPEKSSLLVISFYASELESVFDNPETLNGLEIVLVNQDYHIIYSSENSEAGVPLKQDVYERIQNQNFATVIDNTYVVSVNSCGDDWNVITYVPTSIILPAYITFT